MHIALVRRPSFSHRTSWREKRAGPTGTPVRKLLPHRPAKKQKCQVIYQQCPEKKKEKWKQGAVKMMRQPALLGLTQLGIFFLNRTCYEMIILSVLTLLEAFLYLVTAWLMRSLTRRSPLPQGTTTLTGPKQTVTFMMMMLLLLTVDSFWKPQSRWKACNPVRWWRRQTSLLVDLWHKTDVE